MREGGREGGREGVKEGGGGGTDLETKVVCGNSSHIVVCNHHGNEMDKVSSLEEFEIVDSTDCHLYLPS